LAGNLLVDVLFAGPGICNVSRASSSVSTRRS